MPGAVGSEQCVESTRLEPGRKYPRVVGDAASRAYLDLPGNLDRRGD